MLNRHLYRQFCAQNPDLPLFFQDWYWDALCGEDGWDYVAAEVGGRLVGVWPFMLKKKWSLLLSGMPTLMRMAGPVFNPEFRSEKQQMRLIPTMIQAMPAFSDFHQDLSPSQVFGLPFHWGGFALATRYTFLIEDLSDLDVVFQNMSRAYRLEILPKVADKLRLESKGDLERCYRLQEVVFSRQNLPVPFSFNYLKGLDDALNKHQARQILEAVDVKTGRVVASNYLIYDQNTAYLLLAGQDADESTKGVGVFLGRETIRYAGEELGLKQFNFLGSMLENIATTRRQFGAIPKPYLRLEKTDSSIVRLKKAIFPPQNSKKPR